MRERIEKFIFWILGALFVFSPFLLIGLAIFHDLHCGSEENRPLTQEEYEQQMKDVLRERYLPP